MNVSYSGIIRNGRVPEANIQAEFYMLCRKNGIQILLEVKYQNCRFDALVFKNDIPFAIIEVKNYSKKRSIKGLTSNGRQMQKYMKYNLPIIGVLSSKHIFSSFDKLLKLINGESSHNLNRNEFTEKI